MTRTFSEEAGLLDDSWTKAKVVDPFYSIRRRSRFPADPCIVNDDRWSEATVVARVIRI